jgi:hypothetical protein
MRCPVARREEQHSACVARGQWQFSGLRCQPACRDLFGRDRTLAQREVHTFERDLTKTAAGRQRAQR